MKINKHILFMKGYFPPESASSNQMSLDLIEKLGNRGMTVTVLCPVPTRGVTKEQRSYYSKHRNEKLFENVLVKRFWLPVEKKQVFLRAIRYLMQNLYQISYALSHKYDILFLYSTPPTNGLVGGLLQKIKRVPFIYYLHDIFPDSLVQTGIAKENSRIWKVGRIIEYFSYSNSTYIITLSENMKKNLLNKGVKNEKIQIVPTWVNTDKVKHIEREHNVLIQEYNLDSGKFIVTYAGNIGEAQSVETLIGAASKLQDKEDILFVIVGDGIEKENCKEKAKNLNNVIFIPMQPPERISDVYSLGDISTVLTKKGVGMTALPSKTASIFAAETMILAAFDKGSDLERMIVANDLGFCVEPENEEALVKAILQAFDNRDKIRDRARKGKEYLLNNMAADVCTDKIFNIITQAISDDRDDC